jgi:hypothetical protein
MQTIAAILLRVKTCRNTGLLELNRFHPVQTLWGTILGRFQKAWRAGERRVEFAEGLEPKASDACLGQGILK